jgi:predicted MPP superfamily phosphohydrolase
MDALRLLVAAVLLASLAAVVGPPGGFTVLRFLAQALFGETLLLVGLLSALLLARGPRWLGALAAVVAFSLLGVYVEAYHREPTDLQVRAHVVQLGRFPGRPLRLLHMSDIQTSGIGPYEERVVREAVAQRPDLIVLTGDYVQPRLRPTRSRANAELRPLLRQLAAAAPLGAYAVRGDVDVDWPKVFEGTGIRTLSGESIRIAGPGGRSLTLVGLTSGMSRGSEPLALATLLNEAPIADLRIFLGHNPNFVANLVDLGLKADLVLAGHTHGGQVVLPLFGAPYTKTNLPRRYASGLHDYRGLALHVSAGVGMERGAAPQIRFLCPPEICLLELD